MTASATSKKDHVRPTLRTITKFKADTKEENYLMLELSTKALKIYSSGYQNTM